MSKYIMDTTMNKAIGLIEIKVNNNNRNNMIKTNNTKNIIIIINNMINNTTKIKITIKMRNTTTTVNMIKIKNIKDITMIKVNG